MDYQRIYNEFIADRRAKPVPEGYTERHHVLPRSLGGTDDAENLIDLTAEDHLFAHLLLAKAHGGAMHTAFFLMMQDGYGWGRSRACNRKKRLLYAHAREKYSKRRSELMKVSNPSHREDVKEKRREQARSNSQFLLGQKGNFGKDHPRYGLQLIGPDNGMYGKTHTEETREKMREAARRKPKPDKKTKEKRRRSLIERSGKKTFYHMDGRVETDFPNDFAVRNGISPSELSQLLKGKTSFAKGWGINGKPRGRIAHNRKPVLCVETGEIFESAAAAPAPSVQYACVTGGKSGGYHWQYINQ